MPKPVSRGLAVNAYAIESLDPARAGEICHAVMLQRPRRLALAGKAGAGKTSVCEAVSAGIIPILNHADTLKEEVLELLASTEGNGLLEANGGAAQFAHFCDFFGMLERFVREDCWGLMERPWNDYVAMCNAAAKAGLTKELLFFHGLRPGEYLPEKIKYVERHKAIMRPTLVSYGQAQKELTANPSHWVDQTIARSVAHPACLNGDTRFAQDELEVMEYCGWTSAYLWIDRETQRQRRPEMTDEQIADRTETSIDWCDCAFVIDARQPLATVLLTLAAWLANPASVESFVPPEAANG